MVTPRAFQPSTFSLQPFRRWLCLLALSALAWLYTAGTARAWFSQIANWELIYIAYANDYDSTPVYHPSVAGSSEYKADKLVAYYPLDEASGTRYDSVGSHNLTQVGSEDAGATTGKIGNAFIHPADSSSGYSTVDSINVTSTVAVSAWIKIQAFTTTTHEEHLLIGGTSAISSMYTGGVGYIFGYLGGGKTGAGVVVGEWYHVAIINDGTNSEMWVNGVSSGTKAGSGYSGNLGLVSLRHYHATYAPFIDEVGVWVDAAWADAPAKQAWVNALYNAGAGVSYTTLSTATVPAYVDAPDGGTVSLPITFRCAVRALTGQNAITTAKLQYKATGTGVWADLVPAYSAPAWTINFNPAMTAFGLDSATTSTYAKGADMLYRLYVSDGVIENADPGVDTTEDGTNGWLDQWVLGLHAHATNTKPGRPSQ